MDYDHAGLVRPSGSYFDDEWREQLLEGNGSVSHRQAVDKATDEYKKYKAKTLSDVEQDYLNSLQLLQKKANKK